MTVTKETSLLHLFESKLEEAVSYVSNMCAADKVKAIKFWNVLSEKFQEVVNESASDISAIVSKMADSESEEVSSEINRFEAVSSEPHTSTSSDVPNLSSNLPICNGATQQFQAVNINDIHLVPSASSYSNVTESSSVIYTLSNIPQLNNSTATNSTQKTTPVQSISVEKVVRKNRGKKNSSSKVISKAKLIQRKKKRRKYISKDIISEESSDSNHIQQNNIIADLKDLDHSEPSPKDMPSVPSQSPTPNSNKRVIKDTNVKNQPVCEDNKGNNVDDNSTNVKNKPVCEENEASYNDDIMKNLFTDENDNSTDSYSGFHSDFDTTVNPEDSNSNLEHKLADQRVTRNKPKCKTNSNSNQEKAIVSFVVSNSEEVLSVNGSKVKSKVRKKSKGSGAFLCKFCDKKFLDKASFKVHSIIHSKPFSCTQCDSNFSTKGNLSVHMRTHTGEKPYVCSKCSARFTTHGNLKRHLRSHSGERPHQCSHCDSRFTEKKSLIVHMRRHTGEKPYECKECGKRFSQSGILQGHMAMHLNQRSHLCENCGKSFRQKCQLQIHQLRHENVKKHNCTSCDARFLTKGDLDRHVRSHTGEKPFICEICGKGFTRQQSLNEHTNRHLGRRPYACNLCPKTFSEMSACYKHKKLHEKQNSEESKKKNFKISKRKKQNSKDSKKENFQTSKEPTKLEDDNKNSTEEKQCENSNGKQVSVSVCQTKAAESGVVAVTPQIFSFWKLIKLGSVNK